MLTGTTTLDPVTDDVLFVDGTAGAFTVTLPSAATRHRPYEFIKIDAANNVTVAAHSGETVNGAATAVMTTQWGGLTTEPKSATTWAAPSSAGGGGGGGFSNPMTAQGSLISGATAGTPQELKLGGAGYVPTPVGADVAWAALPNLGGFLDPTTTSGDFIARIPATVSALAVGFIGDSITAGTVVTTAPPVTCVADLSLGGVTVSRNNQGVSGATSSDWIVGAGSGYLSTALAAFLVANVRVVHIMLGTNDSKTSVATSAATYRANILNMCAAILNAGMIPVVSYPPYLNTASSSFDAASTGRVAGYCLQIDSLVDNVHVYAGDTTNQEYFKRNPTALQGDGVHPTQTGSDNLAGRWANALRKLVNGLTNQTTLARVTLGANLTLTGNVLAAAGAPVSSGELLIQDGTSSPPVPLYDEAGSDFLYFG